MRALLVIAVSLVLGASLGVGITWARYGASTSADAIWTVAPIDKTSDSSASTSVKDRPKVSVDAAEFDFGAVENDSLVHHEFRFTNVGTAPLKLTPGATSCPKCTVAAIEHDTLAPGASVDVSVQYHAAGSTPQFRQSATIQTNDPDRPRVELSVTGSITSILSAEPHELVFSKLSVHDTHTLSAKLLNHLTDSLSVIRYEWSDKSTEKFVDVQFKPLDASELEKAKAKSGQWASVTIKPGLPLGAFRQKLTVTTNLPDNRAVELDILATIASDISLVGGGWKEDYGFLDVGAVSNKVGARRTMWVSVGGPARNDVQLTVGEVSPSFLKVSIGPKSSINDGAVVRFPLTIEIPPGSPSANHLGSKLSKFARITLETTHPEAKRVNIPVRFAVED